MATGASVEEILQVMDEREIYELRQLCTTAGLTQDALGNLIDSNLSVPKLVRSEAAAMADAKKAGLSMAERQKLRDALRKHKDEVLSSVEPRIVDIGDDAEAHHIVAAQQQLAIERAKARAGKAEESKGDEFVQNGNVLQKYRWTQEQNELTVAVELPPGTNKRDVVCKITTQTLVAGVRNEQPIIDGTFYNKVKLDDCMWQLQDQHRLIISLPKLVIDKYEWWPCLIKGEPEINTDECKVGEATNLFCNNGDRRIRIQKIELPENRDPKKKYSPEEAEKAWKNFFTKFPDWGAWEITFNPNQTKADGTKMSEEEALVDTLQKGFLPKNEGEW
eukprot:CAMPEP_0119306422 /NCGR_PEP_ID=MMETSP1333-20130426/7188_1 /TAXON_ID=418940 /ORGANISM="Scyphosphaera apsteinii, Strain RCC1455" /LENGTH=332 /DNA_ID=CAMNT_0007309725 /DNA_START=33 /DNA_END=1028 /DNA_ORIENTATION=+